MRQIFRPSLPLTCVGVVAARCAHVSDNLSLLLAVTRQVEVESPVGAIKSLDFGILTNMAAEGRFCPESCSSAAGSRISRAAAFGDEPIDETVSGSSGRPGQSDNDVKASLTSSGATVAGDNGEHFRQTAQTQCALRKRDWSPLI